MNISNMPLDSLDSVKQAINIATLKKAMHQDTQSMTTLINDMRVTNAKILEQSVTPHKGGNIDVRI